MQRIGQGGMGTVYAAYDPQLERKVALKVVRRLGASPRAHERLEREARAMASLAHPNVVTVFDAGRTDDGSVFIAMELVEGTTLRRWLDQAQRSWREIVPMFIAAGRGLAAAHARGLVHRDFKPDNVLVGADGRPRVADFGLARGSGSGTTSASPSTSAPPPVDASSLTVGPSTVGGTLGYMAPEQRQHGDVGPASDQFSFCVALLVALRGVHSSAVEPSLDDGRAARGPGPARLWHALRRGLAEDPAERWPSMDALLTELHRVIAPRRWLAIGAAVSAGLAVLGIGLWHEATVGQRCAGAELLLEGVWDDTTARAVEAAISSSGREHAAETWRRTRAALDRYAESWMDHHDAVCEASRVHEVQSEEVMDLRMACLNSRRLELREVVAVLVSRPEAADTKALELVTSLPSLSRCDDVEALRSELPPPEDPAVARSVEALRERIVGTSWLLRAELLHEAQREIEGIVQEAEALAYPPVLAEALLLRANARDDAGDYAAAEQDLERGYLLAIEQEHTEVETRAAGLLTLVVGVRQQQHDEGERWGKLALALAARPHTPPEDRARVWTYVGHTLRLQGRWEEALRHYQRALEVQEAALEPGHPHTAASLQSMSMALESLDRLDESLARAQRALEITEVAFGPDHAKVAAALMALGTTHRKRGDHDEALRHHERALAIYERVLGPEHPNVALALNNVANTWAAKGKLDEALEHYRRALVVGEAAYGPDHPNVAGYINNIGMVHGRRGELEQAKDHYERALKLWEEALGPDHPHVAGALLNVGNALGQLGQLEQARPYFERAVQLGEQRYGPTHSSLASPLLGLGNIHRAQGELEQARECLERSLTITEEALGPNHPSIWGLALTLGEIMRDQGKTDGAREHFERALATGDVPDVERAKIESWVASLPDHERPGGGELDAVEQRPSRPRDPSPRLQRKSGVTR